MDRGLPCDRRRQGSTTLPEMKTIPLTQGQVALVDDIDFEVLKRYNWHALKDGGTYYAVRHLSRKAGERTVAMHRQLLNPPRGLEPHHIDNDGLNNQRHNLQFRTRAQNLQGKCRKRWGSSRFRGVSWRKDRKKWSAQIGVKQRDIYLGCFDSEDQAARAYDSAAKQYFGGFADPNFPELSVDNSAL